MPTLTANRTGFDVDLAGFQSAVRRWAALTNRSSAEVVKTSAKMVVSNPRQGSGLLQITPPASQGATGLSALRQGEQAIENDLRRVFVGIRFRNKSREDWPNVAALHARLFAKKRPGRPLRAERGRGAVYFVDRQKLAALESKLKARVGWLASGWVASARALGAAVPSWVARHGGGRGSISMRFSAPRYSVEMVCFAPANSPWQELERRIPYALRYATNNLERQIAHRAAQDAGRVGFNVRGA